MIKFLKILSIRSEIIKIDNFIGQIINPFEWLEEVLDKLYRNDNNLRLLYFQVFNFCLESTNPIKSINEIIKMYRLLYGINNCLL